MLFHCGFALGEVDAERLVVDDIGMLPLAPPGEFCQGTVGCSGCVPELRIAHTADARQIAFDDVTFHVRTPVNLRNEDRPVRDPKPDVIIDNIDR